MRGIPCQQELIERVLLIAVRASERLPKLLGQIVAVKVHLNVDVGALAFCLEPHQRTVIAIQPLAHFPKCVGKSGARNAHMDDPHSGAPEKVLIATV
jgi:hypothetical protein